MSAVAEQQPIHDYPVKILGVDITAGIPDNERPFNEMLAICSTHIKEGTYRGGRTGFTKHLGMSQSDTTTVFSPKIRSLPTIKKFKQEVLPILEKDEVPEQALANLEAAYLREHKDLGPYIMEPDEGKTSGQLLNTFLYRLGKNVKDFKSDSKPLAVASAPTLRKAIRTGQFICEQDAFDNTLSAIEQQREKLPEDQKRTINIDLLQEARGREPSIESLREQALQNSEMILGVPVSRTIPNEDKPFNQMLAVCLDEAGSKTREEARRLIGADGIDAMLGSGDVFAEIDLPDLKVFRQYVLPALAYVSVAKKDMMNLEKAYIRENERFEDYIAQPDESKTSGQLLDTYLYRLGLTRQELADLLKDETHSLTIMAINRYIDNGFITYDYKPFHTVTVGLEKARGSLHPDAQKEIDLELLQQVWTKEAKEEGIDVEKYFTPPAEGTEWGELLDVAINIAGRSDKDFAKDLGDESYKGRISGWIHHNKRPRDTLYPKIIKVLTGYRNELPEEKKPFIDIEQIKAAHAILPGMGRSSKRVEGSTKVSAKSQDSTTDPSAILRAMQEITEDMHVMKQLARYCECFGNDSAAGRFFGVAHTTTEYWRKNDGNSTPISEKVWRQKIYQKLGEVLPEKKLEEIERSYIRDKGLPKMLLEPNEGKSYGQLLETYIYLLGVSKSAFNKEFKDDGLGITNDKFYDMLLDKQLPDPELAGKFSDYFKQAKEEMPILAKKIDVDLLDRAYRDSPLDGRNGGPETVLSPGAGERGMMNAPKSREK